MEENGSLIGRVSAVGSLTGAISPGQIGGGGGGISLAEANESFNNSIIVNGNNVGFFGRIKAREIVLNGFIGIDEYAFYNDALLTAVSAPDAVNDGSPANSAFYGCTNLKSVYLPKYNVAGGSYMFYNCRNLESVFMPNVNALGVSMFENCAKLETIRLEKASSLSANALKGCTLLHDLFLGYNRVVTISSSTFTNSGIATDSTARIHVPDELLESYQSSSAWSNYASKIVGDYE